MQENFFHYSFRIRSWLSKNRVQSGDDRFLNFLQKLIDVPAPFSAEYTILMLQIHNIHIRSVDLLSDLLVSLNVIDIDLKLHSELVVVVFASIVDCCNYRGRHNSRTEHGDGIHETFRV